jgi:hypothetical protein
MSAVALVVDDPAALRTAVVGGIGRGCVRLRPAAPRRAALTWPTTSRERSRSRSDSSSAFRTGRRVITTGARPYRAGRHAARGRGGGPRFDRPRLTGPVYHPPRRTGGLAPVPRLRRGRSPTLLARNKRLLANICSARSGTCPLSCSKGGNISPTRGGYASIGAAGTRSTWPRSRGTPTLARRLRNHLGTTSRRIAAVG